MFHPTVGRGRGRRTHEEGSFGLGGYACREGRSGGRYGGGGMRTSAVGLRRLRGHDGRRRVSNTYPHRLRDGRIGRMPYPLRADDRSVVILFHNMKGYDGMFLLRHMYAHKREVVNMVTVGVKVLSFTSDRLTFKDSLCFLPCALASFPSTFGIVELTKWFFPHLFNKVENQEYEGPLPEMAMYDPEGMSAEKREELETWHREKTEADYTFNLRNEMEAYCVSDVKLLKAGCEKFLEEFEDEAGFNPLIKCVAIASACNRYWRKKHVPPGLLALQPVNGWRGCQSNQSRKALDWLTWKARGLGDETRIRRMDNGGEMRLVGMLVDGYDAATRTAYEFNSCCYHGCPRCFPKQRYTVSVRRGDRSFAECYEATRVKKERLEAAGYAVTTQWECDWDRRVKAEPELKTFMEGQRTTTADPLQPRDAFFGGRTNAMRLHHETARRSVIRTSRRCTHG